MLWAEVQPVAPFLMWGTPRSVAGGDSTWSPGSRGTAGVSRGRWSRYAAELIRVSPAGAVVAITTGPQTHPVGGHGLAGGDRCPVHRI
jgi:hypothetical protein